MTIEKELQLVKKFPEICAQYGMDETQSCMAYGFAHGDGWYDIMYNLLQYIQSYSESNPNMEQVVLIQVKEKFGGLRIYYNGGDDFIRDLIWETERIAVKVCEKCGGETDGIHRNSSYWYSNICNKCSTIGTQVSGTTNDVFIGILPPNMEKSGEWNSGHIERID